MHCLYFLHKIIYYENSKEIIKFEIQDEFLSGPHNRLVTSVKSSNRSIRTFCKDMTSPTEAVPSAVKHDPSRKQIESIVKLDYVLTPILRPLLTPRHAR